MKDSLSRYIPIVFAFLSLLFFIFLHSYKITETPAGLYLDETSIGLNAATISETGTDEYGEKFPVYFQAFGEWKNPLYIYTSALIFKIFGISEYNLRITSILFFSLFLWGVFIFSKKLFPKNSSAWFFAIFTAGTLPWFFTLSRISFEVISQIAMAIFLFYFLFLSYCENTYTLDSYKKYLYPILSGLFLALFLYSYSTSRVLAFGILFALFLSFYRKKYWKTHTILIISFIIFIIPYILFSSLHSGALTSRFELLTYIFDEKLLLIDKISIFLRNYFSAFDISSFLLFQGDLNIRHSSGFMGQIFFIPFILFLVGLSGIIKNIFSQNSQNLSEEIYSRLLSWKKFIFLVFLGAPIPAALTSDIHHSLRLLFLGFMICIISLYGYDIIIKMLRKKKMMMGIGSGIIFLGIFIQSVLYFQNYFSEEMKNKTISAFGGYELQKSLEWAKSQNVKKIIFYETPQNPLYASINFYNHVLGISVEMNKKHSRINTCQLWYKWNAPEKRIPVKSLFIGDEKGIIEGACFDGKSEKL